MGDKENNDYINDLPRAGADVSHEKNKALTPEDLIRALLGDDPKAIISAIQGKRAKRLGKNAPPNKYKSRTIGRNKDGKPVVTKTEYTKEYKAKKAAAKKAAAAEKAKKKED